jgi:hypothetical protein
MPRHNTHVLLHLKYPQASMRKVNLKFLLIKLCLQFKGLRINFLKRKHPHVHNQNDQEINNKHQIKMDRSNKVSWIGTKKNFNFICSKMRNAWSLFLSTANTTAVIAFINSRKKGAHTQTMINASIGLVSDFQKKYHNYDCLRLQIKSHLDKVDQNYYQWHIRNHTWHLH